jgi:hypothetical protein
MGILAKAAPVLTEDNLTDIMPVAWELMLETDQELAAAAGNHGYTGWGGVNHGYTGWGGWRGNRGYRG